MCFFSISHHYRKEKCVNKLFLLSIHLRYNLKSICICHFFRCSHMLFKYSYSSKNRSHNILLLKSTETIGKHH